MERLKLETVPIELIEPNPLNPRKDIKIDTHQIQEVLKKRGWETAITAYQKDNKYVILSGHRRWYAATQLKIEKIPVYVVEAPKSKREELERLSSSQGGKEDWTTYEWGKYIFDLYTNAEMEWSHREIAYKTGKGEKIVGEALKVFKYYPHWEIEKYIEEKKLSFALLSAIVLFVEKIKNYHPGLVKELSEEMICANLINKAENKRITTLQIRSDQLIGTISEESLKDFLRTQKMPYIKLFEMNELSIPESFESGKKNQIRKIEAAAKEVISMGYENKEDAIILKENLKSLLYQIELKKMEIELEYEVN